MEGVKTNRFPCLPSPQRMLGMSWFLIGVRIMACPGVRLEGWLRWFAHTLGGVVGEGADRQYPAFAPGSSEVEVGFFYLCVSFVQNLSQLCMHAVIFSPIWFLCILLLEERCVQVRALQHCSKGSQVPACLTNTPLKGLL